MQEIVTMQLECETEFPCPDFIVAEENKMSGPDGDVSESTKPFFGKCEHANSHKTKADTQA